MKLLTLEILVSLASVMFAQPQPPLPQPSDCDAIRLAAEEASELKFGLDFAQQAYGLSKPDEIRLRYELHREHRARLGLIEHWWKECKFGSEQP